MNLLHVKETLTVRMLPLVKNVLDLLFSLAQNIVSKRNILVIKFKLNFVEPNIAIFILS